MKLIMTKDYLDMSKKAASIFIERVQKKHDITLGLATGSTPKAVYELLIQDYQQQHTSYKHVRTVNLDEYIGMSPCDKNSYHQFMMNHLFQHIDIQMENVYIPDGTAKDLEQECHNYEEKIKSLGGIDLQLLGIGKNGHIGFNEPGTSFDSRTHVVNLAESTRQANARFFTNIDEVPKKAITMGIATILEAKEIVLLASGSAKAEAIFNLFHGSVTEQFPASILQKHANVTVIADHEACQMLKGS